MIDTALAGELAALARAETVLVVLDFDGVLAPLVDDPLCSRATPENTAAVRRLLDLGVAVAIVSGRALAELSRVCTLDARAVRVGGHGAEWSVHPLVPRTPAAAVPDPVLHERLREVLEAICADHPGTRVEVKPATVVLHVRMAAEPVAQSACARAVAALRGMPGVRVLRGKDVVEGMLTTADKGSALRWLRSSVGADAVLAVGDDVTDEAMFRALGPGDLGVKVGPDPTCAPARVQDVAQVAELLEHLGEALEAGRPR